MSDGFEEFNIRIKVESNWKCNYIFRKDIGVNVVIFIKLGFILVGFKGWGRKVC